MNRPPLPTFHSDEEAERFVDEADLSDYDLSKGRILRLVFRDGKGAELASVDLSPADSELARRRARAAGLAPGPFIERLVHDSLAAEAS